MVELNIEKIKARDEGALRELFDATLPVVKQVVKQEVEDHTLDFDEVEDTLLVEDITQDVMSTIFTSLDKIRATESKPLLLWCTRIARNVAISHLRRLEAEKRKANIYESTIAPYETADLALDSESKVLLQKAMQRLGKIEKLILELYLEGKSLREIAEAQGLPHSVVYKVFKRATLKLRQFFEEEGFTWQGKE